MPKMLFILYFIVLAIIATGASMCKVTSFLVYFFKTK